MAWVVTGVKHGNRMGCWMYVAAKLLLRLGLASLHAVTVLVPVQLSTASSPGSPMCSVVQSMGDQQGPLLHLALHTALSLLATGVNFQSLLMVSQQCSCAVAKRMTGS